jgi:tripartite-type tricarboxylate transporter receptor subunit TctC
MRNLAMAWGSTVDWRRHAGFAIALTMAMLVAASGPASAQAPYPNRPIRLIVPYPPGAGTDFTGREVGALFSKALGQSVVIDNRPGAAATIGHALVAKSPPPHRRNFTP